MAGGTMRRQLGHLGFELRAVLSHELVQCFVGLGRRLLACQATCGERLPHGPDHVRRRLEAELSPLGGRGA